VNDSTAQAAALAVDEDMRPEIRARQAPLGELSYVRDVVGH
jgi:hypothetical protein